MRARAYLLLLPFVLAAISCDDILPTIDWERMIVQPRGKAFRASPYFDDGRLMQPPPEHTVQHARALPPRELVEGMAGPAYVTSIPLPVDRAVMERGRDRFDIFCATCHAVDGSGVSEVARKMTLRKPPSLVTEPVLSFPVGRVFYVITHGYGLMPEYRRALNVNDRWAVVAYLRALQRSQTSQLAALPEDLQRTARKALEAP